MLSLLAGLPLPSLATDFEVTGPDGRRILLKDDGTWRYQDAAAEPAKEKSQDKPKATGEGVLTLVRRTEAGPHCRFGLQLANETNYEIQNIVPSVSAYRSNGVLYDTRGVGFFSIKPGNSLYREVLFQGITCAEVAQLKVTGGDRCVMGDLERFASTPGECLSRIRVVPSSLVAFEK